MVSLLLLGAPLLDDLLDRSELHLAKDRVATSSSCFTLPRRSSAGNVSPIDAASLRLLLFIIEEEFACRAVTEEDLAFLAV